MSFRKFFVVAAAFAALGVAAGAAFVTTTDGFATIATFIAEAGDLAAGLDEFFFMAVIVQSTSS